MQMDALESLLVDRSPIRPKHNFFVQLSDGVSQTISLEFVIPTSAAVTGDGVV